MAPQEHTRPEHHDDLPDEGPDTPPTAAAPDTQAVDDILDEIDDVLETDSETFVRGFVQKGGE